MPLNNSYDEQAVIQAIASALETFYGTLIEKIDGLNIQKVMKRKNPYLYLSLIHILQQLTGIKR